MTLIEFKFYLDFCYTYTMFVSRATPKHCQRVVELAKEGDILNYTLPFYSLLMALGWLYIVQDEKKEVIAYTCYLIIPGTRTAFSVQTAVAKEHRSKKIGAKLLAYLEDELREKYRVTALYAHVFKPRVVKLLQRLGWKLVVNLLDVALVKKKLR